MDTRFSIKNFRVFDENGASFDLKPLTILTGCNSSGKSSIVKAILLLNDFLSQIKNAIDKGNEVELDKYKIDFYKYPINLLGRFDKTVHEGSVNHKITMEYVTYSKMISKDVTVQLVFAADENDGLNNAYLDSITIRTEDGVIYASNRKDPVLCNLYLIKDAFLEFCRWNLLFIIIVDWRVGISSVGMMGIRYLKLSMKAKRNKCFHT